jgi:hypothetical protein
MVKSLVACAALAAMTLMPVLAWAGYRGGGFGYSGGYAAAYYGGLGLNGFGMGSGRPAFSGYYFRTWNGTTSMPQVVYPQDYYPAAIVYPAVYWHPPLVYTSGSSIIYTTPADRAGNSAGRYHYGGAVRFFP